MDDHDEVDVRVVIEKPFGTTGAEADELNRRVLGVFEERQVFRIDHYLGKETVQNVLAFRFANGMFEPLWNRNYIDRVQITAAEEVGIGTRAGYYDSAGALRDLVQNHMLQLLCLLAMEPPVRFTADEVRDEKVKVLRAITPPTPRRRRRARASTRPGPRAERSWAATSTRRACPTDSQTETYAALRLEVDNWRWAGVPFYLRTGKRLARKVTEIAVTLKPVPHLAFEAAGLARRAAQPAGPHRPAQRGRVAVAGRQDPGHAHAHPPGEHGVPLRHGVHVPVAGGLRAPDPRRHARRRHAVHPQRRGRGAVAHHRPGAAGVGDGEPALDHYEAGSQGPDAAQRIMLTGDAWRAI